MDIIRTCVRGVSGQLHYNVTARRSVTTQALRYGDNGYERATERVRSMRVRSARVIAGAQASIH